MQIQPDKPLPHMQVAQAPPVQTRPPTSSGSLRGKRYQKVKHTKHSTMIAPHTLLKGFIICQKPAKSHLLLSRNYSLEIG